MDDKNIKVFRSLENGARFINENPHLIKGIYKIPLYNDEPKVYYYTSYTKDKYKNKYSEDSVASGVSFIKDKALLKLFGETIERYALSINNNKKFIYESFINLEKANKIALNPESLCPFSDKQLSLLKLSKKNLSMVKLHWVKGTSIIENKPVLVPAQLVYVPYVYQNSEPLVRIPSSTGAAADNSLSESIYTGICEIIERDSFMISYLNKIPSPQIYIDDTKSLKIQKIINSLKKYKLTPYIIDLTTDIQVPSVAAILVDRTELGPAISLGLKAGFDIVEVIIGAIEEAIMLRSWIRDKFIYLDPNYKREQIIRTVEDRAHYWFNLSKIKYLDFWLNGKRIKKIKAVSPQSPEEKLNKVIKLLNQKNIDIIYVNLTNNEIEKYSFKIVKVIIPQLQPLYLDEHYPYFGGNRLYSAPVNMGIIKIQKNETQINQVPHPFL